MTTFLDGPAQGTTLLLQHAPMLLRVTLNQAGLLPEFDALDAPGDEAAPHEFIYAYRRVGPVVQAHINFGRRRGGSRSGFYAGAPYRLVDPQPAAEVLRDNRAWAAWVNSQVSPEGA